MTAKGNAGSSVCPVPPRIAAQIHRLFICHRALYPFSDSPSNAATDNRETLGPPRPQAPRQGMIPCTLSCGYYLTQKKTAPPPHCLERTVWLDGLVLLARRPLDANPDAKHPGKAGEKSLRGKLAFPLGFSRLSWARSLKLSYSRRARRKLSVSLFNSLRRLVSRGRRPLVGGVGAESPQCLHGTYMEILCQAVTSFFSISTANCISCTQAYSKTPW